MLAISAITRSIAPTIIRSCSSSPVALSRKAKFDLQISKECVALRRKIDKGFAKVINERLNLMKERGFEIIDDPHMVTVELIRKRADEIVKVEFEAQRLNVNDDTFKIFDVIIRNDGNNDRYLVISCTFYPQYRQLSVRLVNKELVPTAPHVYDGPHLYELHSVTQKRIQEYLAQRGVDSKLAEFIRYYNVHKEAKETVLALETLALHLKAEENR